MIGYIWTRLQIAVMEMGILPLTKQLSSAKRSSSPVLPGRINVEYALSPGISKRCSGEVLSPWTTFHQGFYFREAIVIY